MWNGRGLWSLNKAVALTRKELEQSALPLAPGSDSGLRACLLCKGKHQVSSPNLTLWFLFDHHMYAPPAKRKCILQTLFTVVLMAAHSQARLFLSCFFHSCMDSQTQCYSAIAHRLWYRWVLLCIEEVAYIGDLPFIHSFCHLSILIYQYYWIPDALLCAI